SSFDAVVSLHSLERAVNKRAFMTEARRLLKDGGKFLIAVKVKGFLRKQGLRKEELEKLLNTQGFKTEALAYGGGEAFAVLVKT
ncbi:MAG: class I SAM-dependent methyltransferase, partial [Candidatus Caldarchaeum sp.]|nr:class I SAM-dependent methyltransferase [Candidatus Caldarchaeum sp.]